MAVEATTTGAALNFAPTDATGLLLRRAELASTAVLPASWLYFSLTFARGNAQEFVHRWRFALWAFVVLPIVLVAGFWEQLIRQVDSTFPGSGARSGLGWSGSGLQFLVLGGSILVLTNLEKTFRASVGTLRWKIKYTLTGVGLIFVVRLYTASQALLYKGEATSLAIVNAIALAVAMPLLVRALLRTNRMGFDVYPSPTILRGSVTIGLVGIYFLLVALGASTVGATVGRSAFTYEALFILVSLVVAVLLAQSDRLRLRLGLLVNRHFRRPTYDYRTVWTVFNRGTAACTNPAELGDAIVRLTADLFQSLSVSIWLFDEGSVGLAASTSMTDDRAQEVALGADDTARLKAWFEARPDIVDVEREKGEVSGLVRQLHPAEFTRRSGRVCVPLLDHGECIGLLVIGDRVGGLVFEAQDYDMLGCVGAHATAQLSNLRLSQRLVRTREVEAFQTMATFFVHDLKNAASTFSLMLANLSQHWDDPEFRKDAMKGLSQAVNHIEHLIGRLGLFRGELKMRPTNTDLNEVVREAIFGLETEPEFVIRKQFAELPPVRLDREQIQKVVTNLVINAKEAMSGRGEVALSTRNDRNWGIVSVRDHGCGMSQDFISRSLFKPFQSTKKNGLGIGMFQSKRIVESHGGRIVVESNPGEGTTFEVRLPMEVSLP